MGTKDLIELPNIGDLITFTNVWDRVFSSDRKYPYGIVTSIEEYDKLLVIEGKENLVGTLAFPLRDEDAILRSGKVFTVRWGLKDESNDNSYRLIHEEWFYNESFIVVQRTNYDNKV